MLGGRASFHEIDGIDTKIRKKVSIQTGTSGLITSIEENANK